MWEIKIVIPKKFFSFSLSLFFCKWSRTLTGKDYIKDVEVSMAI